MELNSLLHGAGSPPSSSSSSSSPTSTTSRPFPSSNSTSGSTALPQFRTPPLPALPIRLPGLHPGPGSTDLRRPDASRSSSPPRPAASSSTSNVNASAPNASLAPLRFIIPSSHCPPSGASSGSSSSNSFATATHGDGVTTVNIRPASSVFGKPETKLATRLGHPTPAPSQSPSQSHVPMNMMNLPVPPSSTSTTNQPRPRMEFSSASTSAMAAAASARALEALSNDNKKLPGAKRNRVLKNPNRSTKSKARPGLRKGKWTEEEERYATQLTNYFKEGLLPIERGTMLRLYLSQKLNCEPMRITKKFTGGECIGKQVFRPCSPTPESRVRLMQAQLELVALEAAFIKKLKENKEDVPGLTDGLVANSMAHTINLDAVLKKRRARVSASGGLEDAGSSSESSNGSEGAEHEAARYAPQNKRRASENIDDASAVGLLLDFFYTASRNENETETEDEDASTVSRQSGASNSNSTASASASASAETEAANDEPDAEMESVHDNDVERSPAPSVADQLTNSPTKRMRTLSINGCASDEDSTKRSRLGSLTMLASK